MLKLIKTELKIHGRTFFSIWLLFGGFSSLVFLDDPEINLVFPFIFIMCNYLVIYLFMISKFTSKETEYFKYLPINFKQLLFLDYYMSLLIVLISSIIAIVPNVICLYFFKTQWLIELRVILFGIGIHFMLSGIIITLSRINERYVVHTYFILVIIIGLNEIGTAKFISNEIAAVSFVLGVLFVLSTIKYNNKKSINI